MTTITDSGNEMWNVFYILGLGYHAYLHHPAGEAKVKFIAPKDERDMRYILATEVSPDGFDEDVIQKLIGKGWVIRKEDNLHSEYEARFELTDKGNKLFGELVQKMFEEGLRAFVNEVCISNEA